MRQTMLKTQLIAWLLVFVQVSGLLFHSVALAQSAESSVDKFPTIDYQLINETVDDPFTFTAIVTDDSKITRVTLQYRFQGEIAYRELVMRVAVDGITYTARIPQSERRNGTVEYFFVADDDQGNTRTSDFPFDPATRVISVEDPSIVSDVSRANSTSADSGFSIRKVKPLYILLGVLAVGAVAGLAGAGGGGGGGGPTDCATAGCTISLVLPPPSN